MQDDVQGIKKNESQKHVASAVYIQLYLDRVQVGAHDDFVERSGQFWQQLGLLLQTLGLGVVIQSGSREEVVDHGHTVVLTWRRGDICHVVRGETKTVTDKHDPSVGCCFSK